MTIQHGLESLRQDLRYAWRTAIAAPAFALVAVLSLALGIGANTAIFSFVNAALLKPLPYPQASRIVAVMQRPLRGGPSTNVAPRSFVEWRDRAQSFESIAIAQAVPTNTDGPDGAEQVAGLWTTPEMFQVFGVAPAIGRTFSSDVDGVVLSHEYWTRRFASDPAAIGRAIRAGEQSTILGVMPAGFRIGSLNVDIYRPLRIPRGNPDAAGSRGFYCYARLRSDVSLATARAELAVLASQIGREKPLEKEWGVEILPLRDYLVRNSRPVLLVLLGVVSLVLVIACANLAGLLLTRGMSRRAELALRASLGASRGRLVRQLIVESVMLAAAAGVAGLFLGTLASRALVVLASDAVAFGQVADVQTDVRVLIFTIALSFVAAFAFGFAPAWQASRFDLQTGLRLRAGGTGHTRGQQRFHAALVIGEVALAVVLLVGAGLLLRTFSRLLDVNIGIDTSRVLTMRMIVMDDPVRRASFTERLLDRVEALPEVRAAGTIQFLPLAGFTNQGPFRFLGRSQPFDPKLMESDVSTVSRGYFAAMGIPLLDGRPFDRRDQMDTPRVAVVNQSFVQKYTPNENPVGMQIIGDWANPKPAQIIGVVGDIRHNGLTIAPRPTVFLAQSQVPGYITYLVVRTAGEPQRLASPIRREIGRLDPRQAATAIQTMDQYVSTALSRPRLYAVLLGAFALLALVLASIGLYGLIAYAVSRRAREIGIRMALGATPIGVLRSTLGQTAKLACIGLLLGITASFALTRLIANLLYGVSATDPATYCLVALLLGGIALLAAYTPARRASRIDPMAALRHE